METTFLEMIKEVFEIENRELSLSDEFKSYEEWDSLARLSLIAEIDDKYNITIEDEVFKNIVTLQDLYTEIDKRIKI